MLNVKDVAETGVPVQPPEVATLPHERLDDVGSRVDELAMKLCNELRMLEDDLGHALVLLELALGDP